MWVIAACGSALFAGLVAILGKLGVQTTDSDVATAMRTCVVLVLAWVVAACVGPLDAIGEIQPRTWLFLVLSGLATGASWVCYFRALQIGDASKVAPVDKLSLVLVAVFAFAFLGERPALREWAGIAMVAGGVLVLALKR